jgi:acyl-CoA thioester hydrolase
MAIFQQEIIIRETHMDVLGHMNNATYLEIFEDSRWDLIVPRGFSMAEMQASQTGPVILECTIKFMKEIRAREKITLTIEALEYVDRIGKLRQRMIKEDGKIACEAIFTYGLFDLKNRKLILPTPAWKKALEME